MHSKLEGFPRREKTWVVVADGGRARILEIVPGSRDLTEILHLKSPNRGRPTRELVSDASGRAFHVAGPGGHSKQARTDAHDQEEQRFARQLAQRLERAAGEDSFDRLVLAADPRTLGRLRKQMSAGLAGRIVRELNLDLTGMPAGKLEEKIRKAL